MASLVLKNLTKKFGDVVAVNNVNLEISDKEICVLVGPSGCGKTTVLRLIAGLETPTEGEIWLDNKMINDVPPKDRNIAMVFQNYALYPHMRSYDNMSFGLKLRGYLQEEIDERVNKAANILNIANLLGRFPRQLSGGQRQRVAVGRAIVRNPSIFLFDEPLSNLDAKLRVEMRTELKKLYERFQATVIYVTHDQVEAMTLGDKIVVMKDGVIQQVASPIQLYKNPANKFVASFIGSPPMNFINCTVIKRDNSLWLDEGKFMVKLPDESTQPLLNYIDKEVCLGIRPEDIHDRLYTSISTPENTFSAFVEIMEPLGNEIIAHLKAGNTTVVAKLPPEAMLRAGEDIEITFDMEKIHIFDNESGLAII